MSENNNSNIIEFKRKEECDTLERLQNMANIFHERVAAFDGSEKELNNLKIELNVIESLFKKLSLKIASQKAA